MIALAEALNESREAFLCHDLSPELDVAQEPLVSVDGIIQKTLSTVAFLIGSNGDPKQLGKITQIIDAYITTQGRNLGDCTFTEIFDLIKPS